jgi:hypothetical protein
MGYLLALRAMSEPTIYAPKISAAELWGMTPEVFNAWRKLNDYPRIIAFLKSFFPKFSEWMDDQKISDEDLIEHTPSLFLADQRTFRKYAGKYFSGTLLSYPHWFEQRTKKSAPQLFRSSMSGRSHRFAQLELLDMGNIILHDRYDISPRHLDFLNISDLQLHHCLSNQSVRLWFCSADNITIRGDFAFVDSLNTAFHTWFRQKLNNLKLIDGSFQRFEIRNSQVDIAAKNAVIHMWNVETCDFNVTMTNTDIRDCSFSAGKLRYPIDRGRAKTFHGHMKRLYSQIGKRKEASHHYYLEKTFERKSFLYPRANYQPAFVGNKSKLQKKLIQIGFFVRYLKSGFLNVLWGYGERTARVFLISIALIVACAFIYCYHPTAVADTHHQFARSLYYSMITFTTLGYGDIHQKETFLQLVSGAEALLGMTFWGILIAGFTSNAKDY